GRDDGSRALPEGKSGTTLAQSLPNTWQLHDDKAPFGAGGNFSLGDRRPLRDQDELGYVAAFSYHNNYSTGDYTKHPSPGQVRDFVGTHTQRDILWGGLLNLNYKLGGLHKFSLKTNFNQSASDKTNVSRGIPDTNYIDKQSIEWDQRSFYLGQV